MKQLVNIYSLGNFVFFCLYIFNNLLITIRIINNYKLLHIIKKLLQIITNNNYYYFIRNLKISAIICQKNMKRKQFFFT